VRCFYPPENEVPGDLAKKGRQALKSNDDTTLQIGRSDYISYLAPCVEPGSR
jgi:hypothetical protein